MVFKEDSVIEAEIEEELLSQESGMEVSVDVKKERVQEINQQIKSLLEERDFLEKEIEDIYDDIERD